MGDFESALHCFERPRVVVKAILKGVLGCYHEVRELGGKSPSLCFEDDAVPVAPELNVLC